MKKDNDLFYICSLVEYIGRNQKLKRGEVINALGKFFGQIYTDAPVLHCEPIAKIADEFITLCNIPVGEYDSVAECKYNIPDYWTIGEVFERLISDTNQGEPIIETAQSIYQYWITDALTDFNTDFYYQPRDYIRECSKFGGYLDG
ncbi:MAG: hypothetical protein J6W76_07190 [Spirochaetales bacterium]|nr:hypothetical protein [Spirochaetales bacterium]